MGPRKDGTLLLPKDGEATPFQQQIQEFKEERIVTTKTPAEVERVQPDMLRLAIEKGAGIETIERLVALQEKMLARKAETEFSEALNRVQKEIKRIAPDATNNHTNSKWATYAAIDRVIRPIYAAEGFSLSFTHAESNKPDCIRVICWVRLGAHKEPYQVDWPVSTKGPKGNDVSTPVQATGISDSYAKRYLVKDIFNIAIGADDTDGNLMPENQEQDFLLAIREASNADELKAAYFSAIKAATAQQDYNACKLFKEAKDKREKELR